jgi:hypothetical protein
VAADPKPGSFADATDDQGERFAPEDAHRQRRIVTGIDQTTAHK